MNATKQVIARFDGLTTYEIVATAKREWNIRGTVDELTEQYFRLLAATYEQVAEHPGAFTALKALGDSRPPVGVSHLGPTAAGRAGARTIGLAPPIRLQDLWKARHFRKTSSSTLYGGAFRSWRRSSKCHCCEDSVSGVRSATAAGIRVVAVASALMHIRLKEAGAILVVDNLEALLRVLER